MFKMLISFTDDAPTQLQCISCQQGAQSGVQMNTLGQIQSWNCLYLTDLVSLLVFVHVETVKTGMISRYQACLTLKFNPFSPLSADCESLFSESVPDDPTRYSSALRKTSRARFQHSGSFEGYHLQTTKIFVCQFFTVEGFLPIVLTRFTYDILLQSIN